MFHTLRARIAIAYVTLITLALLLLAALLVNLSESLYLQNLRERLTSESRLVSELVTPLLVSDATAGRIDAISKQMGQDAQTRITIIRRDGLVLGDSEELPANMENHADRPEFMQAMATGYGESVRFNDTLKRDLLYVATAAQRDGNTVAVVRVAAPLSMADAARSQIALMLLSVGLLATASAIVLAVIVAQRTTGALAHLSHMARRLAAGDLHARTHEVAPQEVAALATSMNEMAAQLGQTIDTLRAEQTRMASILAHMADGLLIVDAHDHVLQINGAAERMLDARALEATGKSFTQVARNHEMTECLHQAQLSGREQTRISEQSSAQRFIRVVATPLPSDVASNFLIILQDLTQIRRLETVRRDFISNISHELRTPIAALQALTETLNDGALEDLPAARRFVAQMDDEVHQLSKLVDDLLDLSAIESGKAPLALMESDVNAIVRRSAERLQAQAERAGVELRVGDAPPVYVRVDASRIEQVMLNLIHNAIKFTPSGGAITCRVSPQDDQVSVSVSDTGVGISAGDLPRIFERFYKVDKARSGGGSGLGLAIAKHIVELHGGRIWAVSAVGEGTTMMFTLPMH
jgi:two-component system phosphate regulon sensor histidine kinase PhoR